MNYNNSMGYRPSPYAGNRNQRGFFPFFAGGILGYGLGLNSRPNFYPVPIWGPRPFYPPFVVYPPFYRR